jgi:uncharacterized RDD family membrane protein YckC
VLLFPFLQFIIFLKPTNIFMEENLIAEDLLSENIFENVQASTGKRFANYLIDVVFFYVLMIIVGILWALISPSTLGVLDNDSASFNILDRLLSLLLYGIIIGLVEGIGKGKTLGKLITGTRAVNNDGTSITFSTGFLRGLARAVPFNAFSALGTPSYPWHDKWTNTLVIDEKLSNYSRK